MDKQKVTLRVAGKEYALVSSDSPEQLTRVANFVDRSISETIFAALAAEGKVLASKVVNAAQYSANMQKAGSTIALDVNYKALEDFATGKTIAELENALAGQTKETMVDAVAGCTLVDALGYLTGVLEAAKAAK